MQHLAARNFERDLLVGDGLLRTNDTLGDRRLRHEERPSNLLGRQSAQQRNVSAMRDSGNNAGDGQAGVPGSLPVLLIWLAQFGVIDFVAAEVFLQSLHGAVGIAIHRIHRCHSQQIRWVPP